MPPSKDDLNKSFIELGSINKRQEKTVRYFEETTIRLVIAYVFTQTLIYFSISLQNPASSISCQHWWIPFCLSSLIAVIFGIGFKRFVTKWERTSYHYDMNFLERELIYHRIVLLQESQGRSSDQATTYDEEQPKVLQCDMPQIGRKDPKDKPVRQRKQKLKVARGGHNRTTIAQSHTSVPTVGS
ncbi:hypothetical protein ACE6H2_004708 [Prunus campanulata]